MSMHQWIVFFLSAILGLSIYMILSLCRTYSSRYKTINACNSIFWTHFGTALICFYLVRFLWGLQYEQQFFAPLNCIPLFNYTFLKLLSYFHLFLHGLYQSAVAKAITAQ